jgi:hypothetical protein
MRIRFTVRVEGTTTTSVTGTFSISIRIRVAPHRGCA